MPSIIIIQKKAYIINYYYTKEGLCHQLLLCKRRPVSSIIIIQKAYAINNYYAKKACVINYYYTKEGLCHQLLLL